MSTVDSECSEPCQVVTFPQAMYSTSTCIDNCTTVSGRGLRGPYGEAPRERKYLLRELQLEKTRVALECCFRTKGLRSQRVNDSLRLSLCVCMCMCMWVGEWVGQVCTMVVLLSLSLLHHIGFVIVSAETK